MKINPNTTHIVDADIVKKVNFPLYFQFYYKTQKDDFTLKKIDQFHMYEVIATFILNKIYLGPNSAEKMQLINALLEKMDFKDQTYTINKIDFEPQIKQYKYAYHELLSIGYIKEINISSNLNYAIQIYFGNNDFLAYTIAKKMLDNNDLIFNEYLIQALNDLFQKNPIKLYILKWCIIYALKSGQSIDFELLHKAGLNPNERSDLIIFLGDLFKKEFSPARNSDMADQLFMTDRNIAIFNYFLGIEFVNPEYKKALSSLLHFNMCSKNKILLYCSMALISIIELDVNQLEEQLINLKRFPAEEYEVFPVDPLTCLETIYYYLKYGIVKQEAFIELTKFYFNPSKAKDRSDRNSYDVLYLLAVYTLTLCKKPNKILKMISAVDKVHPKKATDLNIGYHFLLKIITAETTLALNKVDDALTLYHEISEDYHLHKKSFTPFMRATFYLLQLRINTHIGHQDDVFDSIQTLLNLAEQNGYKLIKLNCLIFVLENQATLKVNTDFYKLIYHDLIKIIRESGFRGESFVNTSRIMVDMG